MVFMHFLNIKLLHLWNIATKLDFRSSHVFCVDDTISEKQLKSNIHYLISCNRCPKQKVYATFFRWYSVYSMSWLWCFTFLYGILAEVKNHHCGIVEKMQVVQHYWYTKIYGGQRFVLKQPQRIRGRKKKIKNCELLKYQPTYCQSKTVIKMYLCIKKTISSILFTSKYMENIINEVITFLEN